MLAFAVTWTDLEISMLSQVSQSMTPTSHGITYMWNLKKGNKEFLSRTDTDSDFEKQVGRLADALEGLGWKCYKIWCDDCCIPINVIKLSN